MTVYAPTNEPLVVAAGREESTGLLRDALKRVLGAVGILGFASLLVDRVARMSLLGGPGGAERFSGGNDEGAGGAAGNGDGAAFDSDGTHTATETPTEDTDTIDLYLEAEGTPVNDGEAETPTPTEAAEEGTRAADVSYSATNTTDTGGATTGSTAEPTANVAADPGAGSPGAMTDGGLVEAVATLPPGALFFAGGLLVIALAVGWWYTFSYRPAFA